MRASPLAWAVVAAVAASARRRGRMRRDATPRPAASGPALDGAAEANVPPDTTDASPGPHVMLPTVLAAGLGEPRGLVLSATSSTSPSTARAGSSPFPARAARRASSRPG